MTEQILYRLWMIPAAVFFTLLGVLFFRLSPENIKRMESLPRNRIFGLLTGWFALFWCVPHAQAVAPGFLLPLLYPIAIIVPIASFFCLDYMTSRAIGGLLIIFSYEALHRSFDLALPLAGTIAVCSWILGGCGIWISGIPYHFRDAMRLAAKSAKWRYVFSCALIFCAILFVISALGYV